MFTPGRSIRLSGYDYRSPGAYFITIVTSKREEFLSVVDRHTVILSPIGKIALEELHRTIDLRDHILLDEFVIMPNHVHVILWIVDEDDARDVDAIRIRNLEIDYEYRREFGKPESGSLSTVVGAFKAAVSRRVHAEGLREGRIWQPRFNDRIIRTRGGLKAVRRYIRANPIKWHHNVNRRR